MQDYTDSSTSHTDSQTHTPPHSHTDTNSHTGTPLPMPVTEQQRDEIINASNLQKIYGDVTVLNIPSLQIQQGESFGLVGNNGAGKTTLFRLILDLIAASSGEVHIDGVSVAQRDEWKSKVGSFLDEGFLIDFLTPEEYFAFTAKVYNKSEGDISTFLESMKEFFNGEILGSGKLIRDLSKGNQKKTGIAAALISDPQILILDEPFTALDPTSQIRLKKMLNELKATRNMTKNWSCILRFKVEIFLLLL